MGLKGLSPKVSAHYTRHYGLYDVEFRLRSGIEVEIWLTFPDTDTT